MLLSRPTLAAALCLLLSVPLQAAAPAEGVTVRDAWARASAGAATTGSAYVTVTGGSQPDQIVGASTPVAATAQVHQTLMEGGVMEMRPVPAMAVPPGQTIVFTPGGFHIMLTGLKQPLVAGQAFPLTLSFAHTPPVTLDVQVRPLGGRAAGEAPMRMK